MTESDQSRAKRYRERAEEVRTIAADFKDPTTRQILLEVAEDYERMGRTWQALGERSISSKG